ncbi:MAG TPA: ABC transporter permease [Thermoanaerobaculia bacterium]|nr:ABC transporter permease [Thermoanaerobaculia bacterium]
MAVGNQLANLLGQMARRVRPGRDEGPPLAAPPPGGRGKGLRDWLAPHREAVVQGLRHALRRLASAPAFTVMAVLPMALGIGAAAAIFSLINGVLLRPLSYPQPDRLISVREVVTRLQNLYPTVPVNIQHFRFWAAQSRTMSGLAGFRGRALTLSAAGPAQVLDAVETTANLFSIFGVEPQLGRTFMAAEQQTGRNRVVVISDRLWHERFGARPELIGGTIDLNGAPHTVIGVLPAGFRFPRKAELGALTNLGERADIFRPLGEAELEQGWGGDYDYCVVARLRPGVTRVAAAAELELLENRILAAHPDMDPGLHADVASLQETMTGSVRTGLLALLLAVGLLLVIVCVNLANLMLARFSGRAREFAIRLALGASRARLEREVVAETAILGVAGGLLGIPAAALALRAFVSAAPADIPRLDEVAVDARMLCFAIGLCLTCGLLSGLLPARRIAAADPQATLRAESHALTENRAATRLRQLLVGSEVALSTVLLVLAGLLGSSLVHLLLVDKGFRFERALAAAVTVPSDPLQGDLFARLLEQLRTIPGVRSAAFVSKLPLTGESNVNPVQLDGADQDAVEAGTHAPLEINVRFVGPGYFATLGIPLLAGRDLEERDRKGYAGIVSARLAAKLWPGRDPLGKRFTTGSEVGKVEVVGVVKDVHNGRLEQGTTLIAYVPYFRRRLTGGNLVLGTAIEPQAIMRQVRELLPRVDSRIALVRMRTMGEVVAESLAQRRFQMDLAAAFALSALSLAVLGVYGVVSQSVARRRTEIGVRMAVGARVAQVVRYVMAGGLRAVAAGIGAGLVAAIGGARLLEKTLFGVGAFDPLVLAGVAALLTTTAAAACLVPAVRAARIDPANVLRRG